MTPERKPAADPRISPEKRKQLREQYEYHSSDAGQLIKALLDALDHAEKKAMAARNLPRLVELLDTIGSWSDVHDAAQALLDALNAPPRRGIHQAMTALQDALDLDRREG